MFRSMAITLALCLATVTADAALLSRAGGQAYYDDVLDITWIADANLADTTTFGVLGINASGTMTWARANEWIAAMNTAAYLGKSDWRLPTVTDTGTSGCTFAYTATDCGFNVDLTTGEMARMYYSTLGNTASYNTSGSPTGCSGSSPYCLTNTGPFSNLQPWYYWSGTEYGPSSTNNAWYFGFNNGYQSFNGKSSGYYTWAVRPGDIGDVIDSDNDGVVDNADNCTQLANPAQCDSDGDGYGNRCDGDLNNNTATNSQDYVLFRAQVGQPSVDPTYNQADINCNGTVNSQDYVLFRGLIGQPSGPSGLVP